jgi:hypothetical protein
MRHTKNLKTGLTTFMAVLSLAMMMTMSFQAYADPTPTPTPPGGGTSTLNLGDPKGTYKCGTGQDAVSTTIDIGCKGEGNPIVDAAFAIIRLLSDGVGLVVIGSIILGGIQYSASGGDPQATSKAIHRIRESLIALLIFIFGYAILNYVIPAGFLQ